MRIRDAADIGLLQYMLKQSVYHRRSRQVTQLLTHLLTHKHLTILSVTCMRLSYASVIGRVTYFQFPIESAFLQYIAH